SHHSTIESPAFRSEQATRRARIAADHRIYNRVAINSVRERAPHADIAQAGIVEIECEVTVARARRLYDREILLRRQVRKYFGLDVVLGKVADAFSQFEHANGGIGNDLEQNGVHRI